LDLVDSFLARYAKEYDYYDQVAYKAAQSSGRALKLQAFAR
jgi:hypothetical protein